MHLSRCNFLSVTPSPSQPLLHITKWLTHAQSQFPVKKATPFIGCRTGWAEYIIMRAMTFMNKFPSCVHFRWQLLCRCGKKGDVLWLMFLSYIITRYTIYYKIHSCLGDLMVWYLHFSGYESRQLGQKQEEYKDTAENGNCGQRRRELEWTLCLNLSHCWAYTWHFSY